MRVDRMAVEVNFLEDILGSWPADEELFTRFVSAKAPAPWVEDEEKDALPERTQETGLTVFPQDEKGVFIWDYQIKGFLKEAGNVLKDTIGVKMLRNKVDNYVFVRPRKIYIYRNGEIVKEPDDIFERPLRGETLKGPRVSLVASERVKVPASIRFIVEVVQHKEVNLDVVAQLLDYGVYKGLGQWRNGGWGRFEWKEIPLDGVMDTSAA